jgi:hypothetical protein
MNRRVGKIPQNGIDLTLSVASFFFKKKSLKIPNGKSEALFEE